ncbi:MAG: MBL fold metallo-hydrolase [Clostridia bacterium]|nr:MBL fold metallo-hydrolase [Clostridia bacterium]
MPKLYILTEHSPFMMSYVFITDGGRAVIIDGGRESDMPHLREIVGGRKIAAWILTHPHLDHIAGFVDEMKKGEITESIERIYYNFPSEEFTVSCPTEVLPHVICDFNKELPKFSDKCVIAEPGLEIEVDELKIEFLFAGEERYLYPKPNLAVNESSIVFKVTSPGMRSVLFLGDLGPEGGRDLLRDNKEKLKSDIVQMSHHGHGGVTEEVYRAIAPEACMWNAPDWLWEEEDIEHEPELWGTWHQRKWMVNLGVCKHYVSKDGTQEVDLMLKH